MRWALMVLLVVVVVIYTANAYLVDQVSVSEGDVVKIFQKFNNTTTTFKVYVGSIDEDGLIHLRITKNDEYLSSPVLGYGDCYSFGKIKIKYVEISDIPFLKVYCEEGVECNISKISANSESTTETKKESVNVTVLPSPLLPNKNFIILIEGVKRGKVCVFDLNGWGFSEKFSEGDIIRGKLPQNVGDSVIIRVLDTNGNIITTKIIPVKLNYYEQVSATVIPSKPIAGGGMVVMLSKPISGTALLIDAFTGKSNITTVQSGIARFNIPPYFVGPLILRVMDNNGKIIYQTVLELNKGEIQTTTGLRISVSPTTINAGQSVTVRVSMNGEPCDANVYVVDKFGDVVTTATATNGIATIKIDEEGVFKVYAKKGSMRSNEVTVEVTPKPLTVTVQTPNPKPNQPITIRVTEGAYYTITGPGLTTPIEGTSSGTVTFTPTKTGTYTITAILNGREKTVTINVVETYNIEAYTKSDLLGTKIVATVTDSNGNPATGMISVRYPDGHTEYFELNGGMAEIPVSDSGNYILTFKGSSTNVYVKSNQSILPIVLTLGLITIIGYAIATNKFDIRDRIMRPIRRKRADILK